MSNDATINTLIAGLIAAGVSPAEAAKAAHEAITGGNATASTPSSGKEPASKRTWQDDVMDMVTNGDGTTKGKYTCFIDLNREVKLHGTKDSGYIVGFSRPFAAERGGEVSNTHTLIRAIPYRFNKETRKYGMSKHVAAMAADLIELAAIAAEFTAAPEPKPARKPAARKASSKTAAATA